MLYSTNISTCLSKESKPGHWIYRQTLHNVAVKTGFHRKAVEVYYISRPCDINKSPNAPKVCPWKVLKVFIMLKHEDKSDASCWKFTHLDSTGSKYC